mmetsp:Transcript_24487/g.52765  ORF Transcript_24487/g.52765 Transcript_24487/m.52765 type:complete len:359 (-) Transcript_24487:202-1278(-)
MMGADEQVEILANEEMFGAVVHGPVDGDIGAATVQNERFTSFTDAIFLPTIVEIAGIDSSDDSLPDNVQQPHLYDPSFLSMHKRPIGVFLLSERQNKLRKAASNSDFEMRQLTQQLALTQQYTDEIVAMRREQTRLEERLKKEREEIAFRNIRLLKDLQELEQAAAQIFRAETEVTLLRGQYESELHFLGEEKEQVKRIIQMQPTVINHNEVNTEQETIPQTAVAMESATTLKDQSPTLVRMVESKISDGPKRLDCKGTRVHYKNTATNTSTPAITLDAHLDGLLEPYYSIQLGCGREKHTDNAHLQLLDDVSSTADHSGEGGNVENDNMPRDGSRSTKKNKAGHSIPNVAEFSKATF